MEFLKTKNRIRSLIFPLLFLLLCPILFSMFGCMSTPCRLWVSRVDSLNDASNSYWYKDLDEVMRLAVEAEKFSRSCGYSDGLAGALLNQSFVAFEQMDYQESSRLAQRVLSTGRSQILLLSADVLMMRLCVRTSHIESFFFYRNSAQKRMARIVEEDALLAPSVRDAFRSAKAIFHLASAAYYSGQGQTTAALGELEVINREQLRTDTVLNLATMYVSGCMGYETGSLEQREIVLRRFDDLFRVYTAARAYGYRKFEGRAAAALSMLFMHRGHAECIGRERPGWWDYLYGQFVGWPDGRIEDHLRLAEAMGLYARNCLKRYGDIYGHLDVSISLGLWAIAAADYQKAESRLLRVFDRINDYHARVYPNRRLYLPPIPDANPRETSAADLLASDVFTVPELIARLREHMSVVCSARGDHLASNYNRNAFMDLLEGLRQDKETESRYRDLKAERSRLHFVLWSISLSVVFWGGILIWLFRRWNKSTSARAEAISKAIEWCDACWVRSGSDAFTGKNRPHDGISEAFSQWVENSNRALETLERHGLALRDEREACEVHVTALRRRNLEKRAKVGLVYALLPLIERLLNEVRRCRQSSVPYNLGYALELIRKIDDDNTMLAGWIRLHRGEISLHVERFGLNALFDVVRKARQAFIQRGIAFEVRATDLSVRADRALTLFMVNTLIDNARKFTPAGGHVFVWAESGADYVEISVSDDGEGLTDEECRMLSGAPVVDAGRVGRNSSDGRKGHGFGLMNCRGIIEKYRKTNALFRVCLFGVESQKGKGSRFFFRLPLGGRLMVLLLCCLFGFGTIWADQERFARTERQARQFHNPGLVVHSDPCLRTAYAWADSLFLANLEGHYADALTCADSAFAAINRYMVRTGQDGGYRIYLYRDDFLSEPAEVVWATEGLDIDYSLLLALRGETAAAALGNRNWEHYYYNNTVYTRLYKVMGRDPQLAAYCDAIVRSQANLRVSIGLIVLIALVGLFCFYMIYFRKRMMMQFNMRQAAEINRSLAEISDLLSGEEMSRQLSGLLNRLWEGMNEVHTVGGLRVLLLGADGERHRATVGHISDEQVADSLLDRALSDGHIHRLSGSGFMVRMLTVRDVEQEGNRHMGVLFLETDFRPATEAERLIDDLIISSFALVLYRTIWLRASEFNQIDLAREERDRVRYEEDQLHVQNQVLDNCLSAIKHESMYYPSRIRQLLLQLDRADDAVVRARLAVDLEEVISYYKEIYTILCEQAGRQLAVAQFKRRTFALSDVFERAQTTFEKVCRRMKVEARINFHSGGLKVRGDEELVLYLIENLLSDALRRGDETRTEPVVFSFTAEVDGSFVRVTFVDSRPLYPEAEIRDLFVADMYHISYLLCRQIIREHDVYFNHCGCRIEAEPYSEEGGIRIWFTIPKIEA